MRAGEVLALASLLSVLLSLAGARAASSSANPDPAPHGASRSAAPAPDPAPQAASASSSSSSPNHRSPIQSPAVGQPSPAAAQLQPQAGVGTGFGAANAPAVSPVSTSAQAATATSVVRLPAHRRRRAGVKHHVVPRPIDDSRHPVAAPRGRDPVAAGVVFSPRAPTQERSGLPLLFGAFGLIALAFATGSTLRMLVRREPRFRTG
jgi:hypothetical protein